MMTTLSSPMVISFPAVEKGSLYFSCSNQQRATVHCTLNLRHPLEAMHRGSLFVNNDADFSETHRLLLVLGLCVGTLSLGLQL